MKYDLKAERKNESGAIMLEIIAVLSLMGVMGAMLFRQINHRNQELHNIQMASEIRVAKEAFSAYIQSNLAILRRMCTPAAGSTVKCPENSGHTWCNLVKDGDFLPDGYGDLCDDYTFELFAYMRGNSWDAAPAYYGVVLPKTNILPDGGTAPAWNFKRAARVAMLIGGDGGVYGKDITLDGSEPVMSGTAGSWQLDIAGNGSCEAKICWADMNIPVYGATTGFDVYQPEVEVEDAKVNLPDPWDLVVHDLGSYGAFAVGMADSNCYSIKHTSTNASSQTVDKDTVYTPTGNTSCEAVLWIDGKDSKVYTSKGIEVGYDKNTGASAVSIEGNTGSAGQVVISDDEGRAKIILDGNSNASNSTTLTIKDGAILTNKTTGEVGEASNMAQYQYQLDPANTSVVYDIRLGALGGAKLSQLLPDVILKDVGEMSYCSSGCIVSKPDSCPVGYDKALLIIPKLQKPGLDSSGSEVVTGVTQNISGEVTVTQAKFKAPKIKIDSMDALYQKTTGNWNVTFEDAETTEFAYQTYCVRGSITNATSGGDAQNLHTLTSDQCAAMGFGFASGHCSGVVSVSDVNSLSNIGDKPVVCRRAGYFWNGTTCLPSKPSP